MATIGSFTSDREGLLIGQIRTLTLDTPVQMEPVTSDTEGAPAYRLYAGEIELGAAWSKTARESGRAYHQVRLDDPSFSSPIFANLIQDEATGQFNLIWNRPKPRVPGKRRGSTASTRPGQGRPAGRKRR